MQAAGGYEPLPSTPEDGGEGGAGGIGSIPGSPGAPPDALLGSEAYEWEAIPNLDTFFTRIYRYWEEKGFTVMLTARLLNLMALAFTVAMSALLLLYVNWGALQAECLRKDTCDIWEVAIRKHPLSGGWSAWKVLAVNYLILFSAYWLVALAHLLHEVRDLAEIKHFCNHKLGISERQMGTITWPEVAQRLVQVQRRHRLCMARDLSEHDIVARVMRRENYLVGMLNKGVLALNVPVPGFRRHFLLTKTLEWNLYWCVLDAMFDDHFRLKPAFLHNTRGLQKRFRVMALCNLAAAPFLLVFLLIYFFMKNAEKFYHHPSSVGARRWSPLAKWRLREFNELPHFISHRLNASHKAAEAYIQQFPSLILSHLARFVAFVAGSVAALLLFVTLIDERLLERDLFGRQLVWWVAVVGVVLALSRAFVIESGTAFDPEQAMMEVVAHTHYLPRHWRGRAHTREVQQEFQALFQYKALLFLEELSSILLTPLLLWFSLPQCAAAVLSFVEQHTVHVEGVGDVCSLAAFDFQRHGNVRYGAPTDAPKLYRSRQGKMEKSFLSFAATYPSWEPGRAGQQLLQQVAAAAEPVAAAAMGMGVGPGGMSQLQQSLVGSMLPLQQQQQVAGVAGAAGGHPGLLRQSLLAGGANLAQQQLVAAALAGRAGLDASIFASADLTAEDPGAAAAAAPAKLAASLAVASLAVASLAPAGAAVAAGGPLDRVSTSQLLLQSVYEQHRGQHHPLHPTALPPPVQQQQQQGGYGGNGALGGGGGGAGLAASALLASTRFQHTQQQQQQQAPLSTYQQPPQRQQAQQRAAAESGRLAGAAATPVQQAVGLSCSPSPQRRVLGPAVGSGGVDGSPRQPWLGRSPSGRTRISELSVLSRQNSGGSERPAAPSPGGPGLSTSLGAGAGAGSLLLPSAQSAGTSPATSESLLQQHLLHGSGLHGSGLHSSALHGSGLHSHGSGLHSSSGGAGSDEPPEFF